MAERVVTSTLSGSVEFPPPCEANPQEERTDGEPRPKEECPDGEPRAKEERTDGEISGTNLALLRDT